jgi:hypothetical protein
MGMLPTTHHGNGKWSLLAMQSLQTAQQLELELQRKSLVMLEWVPVQLHVKLRPPVATSRS